MGDRSSETGGQLWEGIKDKGLDKIMTDYWIAYPKILPGEKHIQSKSETFTVEGYNSLFRHFLARLTRKSKCYSKNIDRLKEAILMLMLKRNNQLSILSLTMPDCKLAPI